MNEIEKKVEDSSVEKQKKKNIKISEKYLDIFFTFEYDITHSTLLM